MKPIAPLLLDLWRLTGLRLEIGAFAAAAGSILVRRFPLRELALLSIDHQDAAVEILATCRPGDPPAASAAAGEPADASLNDPQPRARPALHATDRRAIASWLALSRPIRQHAGKKPHALLVALGLVDATLVRQTRDDWLVMPLAPGPGPRGALVLRAERGGFGSLLPDALVALAEPFAAALAVGGGLQELAALRATVAADRSAASGRTDDADPFRQIIGSQSGLRQVLERVQLVARSDMPVLIFGETGSGKEVIARAIHERSPRAGRPFLRVNCGAIAPELIDSELFGHEKGAFTGATSQRRGWFERAADGTLLLDEIAELPLPAQVRLLRVLQDGTFERVGGERTLRVDVRIVAATHRDLPALVQNGSFREDLWYRIAGFPLVLPPLRERQQDIAALTEHFARRAAQRFGLRPQAPTAHDLALLVAYDWPGNIRELASVIDRAAILGDGKRLDIARALGGPSGRVEMGTAPEGVPQSPPNTAAGAAGGAPAARAAESASAAVAGQAPMSAAAGAEFPPLDAVMRRHIEIALAVCRGRIEGERGAARLLEINPHTLRARMRKLGIDWSRFR